MSKQQYISMSVIRRLPRYHRFVKALKDQNVSRISSKELSKKMRVTASQVRQDFNCFGEFGLQGYGYNVDHLFSEINRILGLDSGFKTILVGAGHLGQAIATHMSFEENGFQLIGIFDKREDLVGTKIVGKPVYHRSEMQAFCEEHQPKVAILCLPKDAAISAVEDLIKFGVTGFWNFAQFDFHGYSDEYLFENVHLSDSMMTLCYRLSQQNKKKK